MITHLVAAALATLNCALIAITVHLVGRVKNCEETNYGQGRYMRLSSQRIEKVELRAEAHARYVRNAVKDASYLGADFMRRLDEHDKQIRKLDKVAHGHEEMRKRK